MSSPSEARQRGGWRLAIVLVAVALLGGSLRVAYVSGTLATNTTKQIRFLSGDTYGYEDLADNLARKGYYARDFPRSRYDALLRPPLYPMALAAFKRAGLYPGGVLWAQALAASAVPPAVGLMAWGLTRRRWAAGLAGTLSAFSPTGVALPSVVLADLPFALLFLAGIGAAVGAIAGRGWRGWTFAFVAGGLFGAAAVTKPALLFWPVALAPVWWLAARGMDRPTGWGRLALCAAVTAVPMLAWASRNARVEGLFVVSTIPTQNLRMLVVPRIEAWLETGGPPDREASLRAYEKVGGQFRSMLVGDGRKSATDVLAIQSAEGWAVVRAHPLVALGVWGQGVADQVAGRWDVYDRQQRSVRHGGPFDPWQRTLFDPLFASPDQGGTSIDPRAIGWTRFALAAAGLVLPWAGLFLTRRGGPAERVEFWRRRAMLASALALVYVYFLALCGTTWGQGSRLMYPAQFAEALLIASAAASIAAMLAVGIAASRAARRLPRVRTTG